MLFIKNERYTLFRANSRTHFDWKKRPKYSKEKMEKPIPVNME
jgi:hypothetical protein